MFEPATLPPTEATDAQRSGAATTDIARRKDAHADPRRRYTGEDFRALIARLSKGAAANPKRPGPSASLIALPDAFAWLQPNAPQAEAEHDTQAAETEPRILAEVPRVEEQELGTKVADGDSLAAEPLPQDDIAAADEPADVGEMAEAPLLDETGDAGGHEPAVEISGPVAADTDTAVDLDLQSAETARTLLDIMAMPTGVQPQERALAGDTLLRLVSRMPVASLIALCDRLCIMDAPPPLLVRRLIQHENVEVSGPLLERCPGISDQDLMTMINTGNAGTLRLIARRRHLSPALTDALIRHGEAAVTIAVVRNPGAALSHEAFHLLAEAAKSRTSLQAPLATRPDTPAPIAFELFWTLPPQLRRYVLSRFLTESANLDRILKIAHTLDESSGEGTGSPRIADKAECEDLVSLIAQGKTTEAAQKLAALAGISGVNAERIITDSEGEPLTVAMKAIGMSRTQSAAAAEILRDAPAAPLRSNRRIAELQNLFDSLSFTKARVLLTYWDWAVEKSGPYSAKTV